MRKYVLIIPILLFAYILNCSNAHADNKKGPSFMPDKSRIYEYVYYEGRSKQTFLRQDGNKAYWKNIYSYGGDHESEIMYREDENGLYAENIDTRFSFQELKYPIFLGQTWKEDYNGIPLTVKIIEIGKTVKTRAGTFTNVVVTKDSEGTYRHYAENVGPILTDQPDLEYGSPLYEELISLKKQPGKVVYWDGMELKSGQIGRLKINKSINLWKREGETLKFVRILKPGEVYRVYSYDSKYGGQYGVGAGYYVTNMKDHIKYETPSKKLLN